MAAGVVRGIATPAIEGHSMTRRQELVLAALAPGRGAVHSPVQVQKLLFLIDREIPHHVGGPYFDFKPYNYGPFDKAVYDDLESLSQRGLVEISIQAGYHGFRLTSVGQSQGDHFLNGLPTVAKDYVISVSEFVRRLSFASLVSAIYRAYPEMKENSVFDE
jgi:uncharacterized protein